MSPSHVTDIISSPTQNIENPDGKMRFRWFLLAVLLVRETSSVVDQTTTKSTVDDPHDDDLFTWATQQRQDSPPPPSQCTKCFLVVGVKTRAVHGFPTRQLIRASWAHPRRTRSLHTRVVFLAGKPDLSTKATATLDALAQEKKIYGDLLTHELGGCVDSYYTLTDKTLGFLQWVSVHHPSTAYVMVVDADVYVRLDRVVTILKNRSTPRMRYYAGQVSSVKLRHLVPTIREPWHKNSLSIDQYPLSEHVPRAIGAHFLLSIDLVRFLSRNRHALRSIGTIEDLSIGFWLRTLLHVRPVHLTAFETTLCGICDNSLASFGDLSHEAMYQLYQNEQHGDAFCRGYSWRSWVPSHSIDLPFDKLPPRSDVAYAWTMKVEPITRALRIDITIELSSQVLPTVSLTPSLETYKEFCDKLEQMMETCGQRLPLTLCEDLFDRLDEFLDAYVPMNPALLALPRSNLPPFAGLFLTINVWISNRVVRWRVFIECLFAKIFPDSHVYVVDQSTDPEPTTLVVPDFVVISAEELVDPPEAPEHCRFLLFGTTSLPPAPQTPHDKHMIVINMVHSPTVLDPQIYVPLASLVFSDSFSYSPVKLLQASDDRQPGFHAIETLLVVPHCSPRAAAFLALDDSLQSTECSNASSASVNDLFALDVHVRKYSYAKFVLAFEEDQMLPGYIGATIVAAFLAGAVPIYDGDDATITTLFNANAFISCGQFTSLEGCAEYVSKVNASSSLYSEMRREKPVVNETAFRQIFSWHPDVLRRVQDEQSLFRRLEDLIMSV